MATTYTIRQHMLIKHRSSKVMKNDQNQTDVTEMKTCRVNV